MSSQTQMKLPTHMIVTFEANYISSSDRFSDKQRIHDSIRDNAIEKVKKNSEKR